MTHMSWTASVASPPVQTVTGTWHIVRKFIHYTELSRLHSPRANESILNRSVRIREHSQTVSLVSFSLSIRKFFLCKCKIVTLSRAHFSKIPFCTIRAMLTLLNGEKLWEWSEVLIEQPTRFSSEKTELFSPSSFTSSPTSSAVLSSTSDPIKVHYFDTSFFAPLSNDF